MPKISWRSNYKLPLSFIVFFVLTFFLVGEQLPALPRYLFEQTGAGSPDKLHILDLSLSDGLLHRPFAYLIIGTVIWGLFRIFSWPVAWTIGAALWAVEQMTLTPLDQRPTLINTIVFTFTFWPILTLFPYFVYRNVNHKKAIIITLFLNLLLFGFFAFQIYVLGNSYRSSGSKPGLPANICPERLIIEKDKPTTAYWEGKILPVSGEAQNWVEKNCP